MVHKWIFNIGAKLRNPSLTKQYTFLKESEQWSVDELEEYQLKQLNILLQEAIEYTPFYAEFYKDQKDLLPLKSLKDLKQFPILEKEDLLEHVSSIQSKKKQSVIKAKTSGSTGQSLEFYRNETADSFNRAAIFRGYSWYGIHPWDVNGYFWGFDFSFFAKLKMQFLDGLQNRFRLFSLKDKDLESFSKKIDNSKFIHGYSSMIYELARYRNKKNIPKPEQLKLVKGTSEKIWAAYQEEAMKAFGMPIRSEYGATESGIIAFECREGNMHINMEGVIVEEIENEIVVTNLQMTSFPVIRYKLGDYIELAPEDETCSCGMQHRILKSVTGRVGELIHGKESVYPSLYFYYVFKNLLQKGLSLNYQIEQHEKGKLEVYIEENLTTIEESQLKKEFEKYFSKEVDYTIHQKSTLKREKGKLKSFISSLSHE